MSQPNNKKGPYLPDPTPLIQAGFDPKTGLPIKMVNAGQGYLKEAIKKILRIQDEQDAIRSFNWYNLPDGLDSTLVERILYYKGQAAFFYLPTAEKFYFLPFALSGTIDIYGRYTGITPLPFNGSVEDGKVKPFIEGLVLKPIYTVPTTTDPEEFLDIMSNGAVIINDYCQQISQTVLPRQSLNDPLLDVESDLYPFARTALLNSTGIQGMRVSSQDEQSNVLAASQSINHAALTGQKYIPVVGQLDFQELTTGNVAKSEEFLMTMQSLDNFRLATHGISNGGIFQKKAHELQSENDMIAGAASSTLQDRLYERQHKIDIINAIWGLGLYCSPSEIATGGDRNFDGEVLDEVDQSGTMEGDQPQEVTE